MYDVAMATRMTTSIVYIDSCIPKMFIAFKKIIFTGFQNLGNQAPSLRVFFPTELCIIKSHISKS